MPHDIFISYRRETGSQTARLLCSELMKRGYSAFLDVEDLKGGHFDEALLQHIESARHFVAVLSSGCLDRCSKEGDWLGREIGHALETQRNVVPMLMPGFSFPATETLPEAIRGIARHSGVVYSHEHFSATMAQLCDFLGPSLGGPTIPKKRRLGPAVAVIAAAMGIIGLLVWSTPHSRPPEPPPGAPLLKLAQPDENLLREVAVDLGSQLGSLNSELVRITEAARQAKEFFSAPGAAAYPGKTNQLTLLARHYLEEMDRVKLEPYWTPQRGQRLQELGLPAEDAHALYATALPVFHTEARRFYEKTAYYAALPTAAWLKEQGRVMEISAECMYLQAESTYYGVLSLLAHFPPQTLDGFEKLRPQLTRLPDVGALSEKEADARLEKSMNKLQERARELGTLVGNEDVNIQGLQAKAKAIVEMENKMSELDQQLEAAKARSREKFKLNAGDPPGLMWGKILRLRRMGMNDDAISSLDRYVELNRTNDPRAMAYVASAKAHYRLDRAGTNTLGVLVMAFENDQPHSVVRIGDILVRRSGTQITSGNDWVAATKAAVGDPKCELLRLQPDGTFKLMTVTINPHDPTIGVLDLRDETNPESSK